MSVIIFFGLCLLIVIASSIMIFLTVRHHWQKSKQLKDNKKAALKSV